MYFRQLNVFVRFTRYFVRFQFQNERIIDFQRNKRNVRNGLANVETLRETVLAQGLDRDLRTLFALVVPGRRGAHED